MYFVLKSLKFYLHYSALHVSDTILSIIRSFSAAHAVSGPVWCLVRSVLQSCYVVTAGKVLAFVMLSQFHEFVVSWDLQIWTESCCVV